MLHDHQIAIFQYLSYEKRNQISSKFPRLFHKLNEKLAYHLEYVEISDKELIIDSKFKWFLSDSYGGSRSEQITHFEKLVKSILNRDGTTIKQLEVMNHPVGFETMCALRVTDYFTWKLNIVSSRYDYTTWFHCLRNNTHSLKRVEIRLEGNDNSVLQEDMIQNAAEVVVQVKDPLPVQAILNFNSPHLKTLHILKRALNIEEISLINKKFVGHRGFSLQITTPENVTFDWKVLEDGRIEQSKSKN